MINKRVVFIADRVDNHTTATIYSKDLEMLSNDYFNDVFTALKKVALDCIHYDSPTEFINQIANHKNDIVLSLWSGKNSRNRRSFIPSICEAYGIAYVGADAYMHAISLDKYLSKVICKNYGIKSAESVLVYSKNDIDLLHSLRYPLVIKPNNEGGSIGIFKQNLVHTLQEATSLCETLLKQFSCLIAEEYIPGYEVSVCISGSRNPEIFEVMQTQIDGVEYFESYIFSAEDKKMNDKVNNKKVQANHLLSVEEKDNLKHMYKSFGKLDYIRIDARINDNGFYLLELTPDCSLRKNGAMHLAFQQNGYNYEQMIEFLCFTAIQDKELGSK